MKISYVIAILAIVVIGLVFFFSGQSEEVSEVVTDEVVGTTQAVPGSETDEMVVEEETDSETTESEASALEVTFTLDSFKYGYSIEEIRVKEGDTVTINLTNSDGLHDWVIDEFNAATKQIKTGENTSVTFVADKKGTFEYYCSVGDHRELGMVGSLVVE